MYLQNCEKQLQALTYLSVHLSALLSTFNNSAPTEWIFVKFDIVVFFKSLSRILKSH